MIFKDQLKNTFEFQSFPKRIISLVPSQSELLWDLGLRSELVGITKFCIHPTEMFKTVERIGGTKTLNIKKIRLLKPDLIIGNKEENEQSQITELQKEFPVWMSDIYNLEDSLSMIQNVGEIVNRVEEANAIKTTIETSFLNLNKTNQSVLYLIWNNPYMAAGKATFIGDMLFKMGLNNVLADSNARYPELSMNEIKQLNPELIYLSSEPFPFNEKYVLEFQTKFPNSKIMVVDGEIFSWYGSRLLQSVNYFNQLLITSGK
jgi:ABC-type Fe3+-hydroxamate transport system substrate-binding protein